MAHQSVSIEVVAFFALSGIWMSSNWHSIMEKPVNQLGGLISFYLDI